MKHTKLVREREYVAEVDVEYTDADRPWGPYLSDHEARKLDRVRTALRSGDLGSAMRMARVYRLTPLTTT